MTRQISKGMCVFCHKELSKPGVSRHLQSCEERKAIQDEIGWRRKVKKSKALHLIVQGYHLPMYWMHLDVVAETPLATLDQFLREIWLECCGHLSTFRIDGFNYYDEADTSAYWWDNSRKNMQVKLGEALRPGQTCTYEYDFGSTTELLVKVVAEDEVNMSGKPIQILARNILSPVPCDRCGEPATRFCNHCVYEDKGYLCAACAKEHTSREGMVLPLVNSPRAGVCGYTGPTRKEKWWLEA